MTPSRILKEVFKVFDRHLLQSKPERIFMSEPETASTRKPSAVETVKIASNYLKGDISQELADGMPGFGKASIHILKNHGTYQQDDREARKAREGAKSLREISFMIRTRIPGGKLTAEQFAAEIDLGDELGNGTVRLTTRQGIQHHGIVKGDLQATIQRINGSTIQQINDSTIQQINK